MAPQAFQTAKIFLRRGGFEKNQQRRCYLKIQKKAQPVIATHRMKTTVDFTLASSQSHPATRLSRPFSCTPSLARAASQHSQRSI
jgi:hypothetical protein